MVIKPETAKFSTEVVLEDPLTKRGQKLKLEAPRASVREAEFSTQLIARHANIPLRTVQRYHSAFRQTEFKAGEGRGKSAKISELQLMQMLMVEGLQLVMRPATAMNIVASTLTPELYAFLDKHGQGKNVFRYDYDQQAGTKWTMLVDLYTGHPFTGVLVQTKLGSQEGSKREWLVFSTVAEKHVDIKLMEHMGKSGGQPLARTEISLNQINRILKEVINRMEEARSQ